MPLRRLKWLTLHPIRFEIFRRALRGLLLMVLTCGHPKPSIRFENPIFAVIELDYTDADQDTTGKGMLPRHTRLLPRHIRWSSRLTTRTPTSTPLRLDSPVCFLDTSPASWTHPTVIEIDYTKLTRTPPVDETPFCFLDTPTCFLDTLTCFLDTRACFLDTLLFPRHTRLLPRHTPILPRHTLCLPRYIYLLPRHTRLLPRHMRRSSSLMTNVSFVPRNAFGRGPLRF